jgi:hypothetical protein
MGHVLLPTKTSRFWNQFSGSVPLRSNRCFHVCLASLVNFVSRRVLWVVLFVGCYSIRYLIILLVAVILVVYFP